MPIFKKKESSLKTPSEQEDLDVLNCVRRTKDCGMPSDIGELKDSDKQCVAICKKKYYGLRRLGEDVHRLGKKINNEMEYPDVMRTPISLSSRAGGSKRRSRGKKSKSKSKSKTHKKSKSKSKSKSKTHKK